MYTETINAEFRELTNDEQGAVLGGEGGFAYAVGWFVGYASSCMVLALKVDYAILTNQVALAAQLLSGA